MAEAPPLIVLLPQQVGAFSPYLYEHTSHLYGIISGLLIEPGAAGSPWHGTVPPGLTARTPTSLHSMASCELWLGHTF